MLYGGFGNAVPTEIECPPGGESWCYNPLVMYIQQNHPGVLSKGSASDIKDVLKRSLKDYNYIPTSNMKALQTPIHAVTDAVAAYQPSLATTLPYSTLWTEAFMANLTSRGGIVLRPKITAPSPAPLPPSTTAIATMRAGTMAAPTGGTSMTTWLLIGGAVVVGGIVLYTMRKK